MAIFETTPEELAQRLGESIKDDLRRAIKAKLLQQIDQTLEDLAWEYAEATTARVESYRSMAPEDFFGTTKIAVVFNNTKLAPRSAS